jgi:hypothetical protein
MDAVSVSAAFIVGGCMSEINERLTLETLKKVQCRLRQIEEKVDGFEAELTVIRSCAVELDAVRARQLSMLKDLHYIYAIMAGHPSAAQSARHPVSRGKINGL